MIRASWVKWARPLGVALLVTATLGAALPADAARRAPIRPLELGAPLRIGEVPGIAGLFPAQMKNPPRNVPAQPNYLQACAQQGWRSETCITQALAAIKHARMLEGVKHPAMILPRNYSKLSVPEQTFVITDLERVARGLRPFTGLTLPLNSASKSAAETRTDPAPVISVLRSMGVQQYGSNWAGDFGPLASDYDWMYNDGYSSGGSINIACTSPKSSGCWGHRDNILGTYENARYLAAGAGTGNPAGQSIAEVMTGGHEKPTSYTYTWRQAVRQGANGGHY